MNEKRGGYGHIVGWGGGEGSVYGWDRVTHGLLNYKDTKTKCRFAGVY